MNMYIQLHSESRKPVSKVLKREDQVISSRVLSGCSWKQNSTRNLQTLTGLQVLRGERKLLASLDPLHRFLLLSTFKLRTSKISIPAERWMNCGVCNVVGWDTHCKRPGIIKPKHTVHVVNKQDRRTSYEKTFFFFFTRSFNQIVCKCTHGHVE